MNNGMLYFKRFCLAVSDVTMKAELPAATKSSSKIIQILYVKHVKYVRISLRRFNYSNYAPNTPQ